MPVELGEGEGAAGKLPHRGENGHQNTTEGGTRRAREGLEVRSQGRAEAPRECHHLDERRAVSLAWCRDNGIEPLGRFGGYNYHNSDQCVIAARDLADKLMALAPKG